MASKRTKRILLGTLAVVVLGGLWAVALAVSDFSRGFSGAGDGDFEEVLLEEGDDPTEKVVMVNIIGEIFSDPEGGAPGATDANIIQQLERAEDDPNTEAIILNVDTPGGGVLASDAIHDKVSDIAEDMPVIALMGDTAASGGYYISAPATEIIAHRFTWTGSIGVIAMIPNVTEAAGKLGVSMAVVKSGALKDLGSPFRDMTDEERAVFQTLIDEAYNGFVQVVAEGRDLPEDRVRELADGRIYSGIQAEELGLVDRLGDRETAFDRAKRLADAEDASLVQYRPIRGLFDELPFFGFDAGNAADQIKQELGIPRKPGASYLWIP